MSSKTGSALAGAGAGFSAARGTVAPGGVAVERNFGDGVRDNCVSSLLISASSAAISSFSARALSEIGSGFLFGKPCGLTFAPAGR